LESYQRLSKALLLAISKLGIQANAKPRDPSSKHAPVNAICFESPSDFEITSSGKKIIGSAQARRLKGVLQHGSIPLHGDITRIVQVLNHSSSNDLDNSRQHLIKKACTLFDITNRRIDWHTTANAIIEGFSEELDISFIQGQISTEEMERAKELVKNKYGHDDWTCRI
jgi:lipoate-protein ligase A